MSEAYREAVRVLHGLRLSAVGAAGDMLWIQFGELKTVQTRSGKEKEVGDWALHLQCPWRFVRGGSVVLASSDFYWDAETGERHDMNSGRDRVFDRNAKRLSVSIATQTVVVREVEPSEAGAFDLRFDDDLKLSVMPMRSDGSSRCESWRLFQPGLDGPHFIFDEEAEQGG